MKTGNTSFKFQATLHKKMHAPLAEVRLFCRTQALWQQLWLPFAVSEQTCLRLPTEPGLEETSCVTSSIAIRAQAATARSWSAQLPADKYLRSKLLGRMQVVSTPFQRPSNDTQPWASMIAIGTQRSQHHPRTSACVAALVEDLLIRS